MMNAIAIMRAYFALFTGRSPATSISLRATLPERAGIVIISMLVFLGGWFSPSVVESRHRTANRLLGAPVPPAEAAPHGKPAAESRPSRPEQPRL
jgi:NADH-quinone oxidoreductase subunit M